MGLFNKKKKVESEQEPSMPKKTKNGVIPYDEDEKTNPKIRLYNEIVRRAMTYNTEFFSTFGIEDEEEVRRIANYVKWDYPELFWMEGCGYTNGTACVCYRCITEDGKIDIKDIERKRNDLKKHAKYFTRGITKKTKPYDALITIYRRLILELDYDGIGLNSEDNGEGGYHDTTKDDNLRSLYSALVNRKVVCAGYAVAIQYLLQTVGISCGYVKSESSGNGTHAFNALKIGKYVYYLDATWGDQSDTSTGADRKDEIFYDYCCVPLKELQLASGEYKMLHTPSRKYYPNLEEFKDTNHEFFRFRKAYLIRYDENQIAQVFANSAMTYDKKEMGRFMVGFRCHDTALAKYVTSQLLNSNNMSRIMQKTSAICKKKKSALKLFGDSWSVMTKQDTATLYVYFD